MKYLITLTFIILVSCSTDFLIIGDSMGSCDSVNGKSNCWDQITENSTLENVSVSGAPVEYQIKNFNPFFQPENVIIFMGFNNIKHLDQSVESIASLYSSLSIKIDGYNSNKIYCIGVPPMNHSLSTTWYEPGDSITNERIKEFNDILKGICEVKGYIFIDTFTDFVDSDNECLIEYSEDGIHPSKLMYEYIINEIKG